MHHPEGWRAGGGCLHEHSHAGQDLCQHSTTCKAFVVLIVLEFQQQLIKSCSAVLPPTVKHAVVFERLYTRL